MAAHNDVICALLYDPVKTTLPAAGRMVFSDGELQAMSYQQYAEVMAQSQLSTDAEATAMAADALFEAAGESESDLRRGLLRHDQLRASPSVFALHSIELGWPPVIAEPHAGSG